jgi:divalent metal cation (Fe/Co/Zn/Cd) transporter
MHFADVDLRVPGDWTVARSHALADAVEQAVEKLGTRLNTHVEPLDEEDLQHGRIGEGRAGEPAG